MLITFCMVANIYGANRVCPLYPFITVVSSSSNASFVHETDATFQFGNEPRYGVNFSLTIQPVRSLAFSIVLYNPLLVRFVLHLPPFCLRSHALRRHAHTLRHTTTVLGHVTTVYGKPRVLLCTCVVL